MAPDMLGPELGDSIVAQGSPVSYSPVQPRQIQVSCGQATKQQVYSEDAGSSSSSVLWIFTRMKSYSIRKTARALHLTYNVP